MQIVRQLLCSHDYEGQSVYTTENVVLEECGKCGRQRRREVLE